LKNNKVHDALAYGAFFAAALMVGGGILAGDFSRYARAHSTAGNPTDERNAQASLFAYAKKLEASDKPRDLVVSAFLQVSNKPRDNPEQGFVVSQAEIDLLRKALALGKNDSTLAWLEAMDCGWMSAACDKEAALFRLSKLEPNNAAVDILHLNEADSGGNSDAAWLAMANGGQKKYFQLPIDAIGAMYYQSLRDWNSPITYDPKDIFGKNAKDLRPLNQEEYRKITALGFSIAIAIPALQTYTKYCKPAPANSAHLQACRQFTEKLATDNSTLFRGLGTSTAKGLFLQSPEKEAWASRRNLHQWQHMNYLEILRSDPSADRVNLEKWPDVSEQDRITAMMQERGIPLSPPAGWTLEAAH